MDNIFLEPVLNLPYYQLRWKDDFDPVFLKSLKWSLFLLSVINMIIRETSAK